MTKRTELEDALALQLDYEGIWYLREFAAVPGRRFKWDFLLPGRWLVEVQGGLFIRGGHSTGVGITRDMEKGNLALLNGYRQLTVSSSHIKSGDAMTWIMAALALRE